MRDEAIRHGLIEDAICAGYEPDEDPPPYDDLGVCQACDGTGEVLDRWHAYMVDCPTCDGTGRPRY